MIKIRTATIIQLVILIGFFSAMGFYYFYSRGRKIEIILDKWINKRRVFHGVITAHARKRFSESTDETLYIPTKPAIWTPLPGSEFYKTNMAGKLVLHGVLDAEDNIYWIRPDETKYSETTKLVEEIVLDKDNQPIYEEVYQKDDEGELVLVPVIDENGVQKYNDKKEPLWQPKTVRRIKKTKKEVTFTEPSFYERAIESDVKLYFLNKKIELREKFKREDKFEKIKFMVAWGIIGMVAIATLYMSYKHVKETMMDEAEARKLFLVELVKTVAENPPGSNKPDGFGKKVDDLGADG